MAMIGKIEFAKENYNFLGKLSSLFPEKSFFRKKSSIEYRSSRHLSLQNCKKLKWVIFLNSVIAIFLFVDLQSVQTPTSK